MPILKNLPENTTNSSTEPKPSTSQSVAVPSKGKQQNPKPSTSADNTTVRRAVTRSHSTQPPERVAPRKRKHAELEHPYCAKNGCKDRQN